MLHNCILTVSATTSHELAATRRMPAHGRTWRAGIDMKGSPRTDDGVSQYRSMFVIERIRCCELQCALYHYWNPVLLLLVCSALPAITLNAACRRVPISAVPSTGHWTGAYLIQVTRMSGLSHVLEVQHDVLSCGGRRTVEGG